MDQPATHRNALRFLAGLFIFVAIVAAVTLLLRNESLRSFLRHPQRHGHEIRSWASTHPMLAPAAFFGVFITLGSVALPVWWLQILVGFGFGLWRGLTLGLLASAITSVIAAALSRFVFADLLRSRLSRHTDRLNKLDERLNHNGLLVVCGVRLAHFIPAGLSNYAIGLTQINLRDVAAGSLIGGLPSTLSLVAIGARPEWLHEAWFIAVLVLLNLTTIILLLLRYFRPELFRRFGLQ